jgi:putative redox protein
MNMPAQSEMVLAKCHVTVAAEDPNYRQSVRCGRHEMIADERPVRGGADAGAMPFEYLLASLGACTSITLRMYAERKGWNIGAVAVSLALRQAKEGTRSIERRVTVSVALTAEQHEKLADICEKTPVTLAVKSGLAVRTSLSAEGSAPPTPQ